jgi:hypothetical protein
MTVLRAGRRKEVRAQIEMDAPLYSPPALVGDSLYLATARRLYLIAATNRITNMSLGNHPLAVKEKK